MLILAGQRSYPSCCQLSALWTINWITVDFKIPSVCGLSNKRGKRVLDAAPPNLSYSVLVRDSTRFGINFIQSKYRAGIIDTNTLINHKKDNRSFWLITACGSDHGDFVKLSHKPILSLNMGKTDEMFLTSGSHSECVCVFFSTWLYSQEKNPEDDRRKGIKEKIKYNVNVHKCFFYTDLNVSRCEASFQSHNALAQEPALLLHDH